MSVVLPFIAKPIRVFYPLCAAIFLVAPNAASTAEVEHFQFPPAENNQTQPAANGTSKRTDLNAPIEVYMLKDGSGLLKGVYPDKNTALAQPLLPGDTVQVVAASHSFPFLGSMELPTPKMEELAREASKNLLEAAKASACGFDPLPETVSPTVEVSFNFLAGGSFSLQATWKTEDLCSP